jgi:cell division protein FtsQ
MDGGGRLDQPLKRSGPSGEEMMGPPSGEPSHSRAKMKRPRFSISGPGFWALYSRRIGRWSAQLLRLHIPRGLGIAASALLLIATIAFGTVRGGHVPEVIDWLKGARDALANSAGFRIAAVSLTGSKEISREEILTMTGVTGSASLLFLDADAARERLLTNPWIADAAVLKLYPDRLQIAITERKAFALWQKDGRVNVIAADGTVLEPFVADRYLGLPLVVGRGAEKQAKSFLAIIDGHPQIRSLLRASIMVAERRWNLRLANGIDVRLPEGDVEGALDKLIGLDRDKHLLSRDIKAVDLRLTDRVTVELSDAAAAARDEALKEKQKKKKGGDA